VAVSDDPANPVELGVTALAAGSDTPSAPTILTAGEDGAENWAVAATDASGRLWTIYFHRPAESDVTKEVRCLRGVTITPPG
jgi:hypothetical protein